MLEVGRTYLVGDTLLQLVNIEMHASPNAAPDNRFEFIQVIPTINTPGIQDLVERVRNIRFDLPIDVNDMPLASAEFLQNIYHQPEEQEAPSIIEDNTDWLNIIND